MNTVTTAMVYYAAAKGIAIQEVESSIDGDIDLRGFPGLNKNVRNGYEQIRMQFRIKADVPDDQLQELVVVGTRYSPVLDSITREFLLPCRLNDLIEFQVQGEEKHPQD